MAKKKAEDYPDFEALSSQVVPAKHVISFTAPYSIPNSQTDDDLDELAELDADDVAEDSDEGKGPTEHEMLESSKANAAKLRKKLAEAGLFQSDGYLVIIEKFAAAIGAGIKTPRIPIATLELTEEELIAQAYMETLYANGEGRYYLTLRWPGTGEIVKRWPIFVKPGDIPQQLSTNPVVQTASPSSLDEFDRAFALLERFNKLQNRNAAPVVAAPPVDSEVALASYILKTPQGVKRLTQQIFGPQTESESLAVTLLQNAEPLGQMFTQIVSLIFANLQALKQGNPAPALGTGFNQPTSPIEPQPAFDPSQELAGILAQPLQHANLSVELFPPSAIAKQIIELSDTADKLHLPPIAHYVEMLARAEPANSIHMIRMLTQSPITLTPPVETWLSALRAELQTYYDFEENEAAPTEPEILAG